MVKQYPNDLGTGWSSESRIACLDHLSSTPPKENNWDKLVWLSDVYQCVASRKSLFNNSSSKKPSIFPRGNLPPNSENWERGINNLGSKSKLFKPITEELKQLWFSEIGDIMLHFIRLMILMNKENPPNTARNWRSAIDLSLIHI